MYFVKLMIPGEVFYKKHISFNIDKYNILCEFDTSIVYDILT